MEYRQELLKRGLFDGEINHRSNINRFICLRFKERRIQETVLFVHGCKGHRIQGTVLFVSWL